ncbi:MAG: PDZ domain-containing protein [Planctomycetota bacterium]
MKSAALVCLLCLGAGLAAGVWLERHRAGTATGASSAGRASANGEDVLEPEGPPRDVEAELQTAKDQVRALNSQVASLKGGQSAPLDPASVEARVRDLRAKIPELVEKKDGAGLIAIMKELAALGPEGYRDAMDVAEIFRKEFGNGNEAFGIDKVQFNKAWSGTMVPLMTWALANAADASPWFRAKSVHMLYWVSDVDAAPIFLEAMAKEKDPGLAQALAGYLARMAKPEMVGDLEAAIRGNEKRPQTFQPMLQALVDLHTPESGSALRNLQLDASPALAAALEIAIIEHAPPAPGIMITSTQPKSQAQKVGLQKGDILMSYDGVEMKTLDQLRKAVQAKPDKELVPVMVNRGGTLVPVQITGDWIGIDGKPVKP